jgi:UrcA family protein
MATSDIRTPVWTAAVIGAMVCGALVFSHAAMAQPAAASAPTESQEITVIAPEVVRKKGGTVGRGQSIEIVSTTQEVEFADLDINKPSDLATLKKRIRDAAREACRRLDQSAPLGRTYSVPPGCEANAAREPLALADQLAAAAQGK